MTSPRVLPYRDPDDRPTRAQLDREEHDAARTPPAPWLYAHGHRVVGRLRMERVHHLADGDMTLCGQLWETRVISNPHPTCDECVRAVGT